MKTSRTKATSIQLTVALHDADLPLKVIHDEFGYAVVGDEYSTSGGAKGHCRFGYRWSAMCLTKREVECVVSGLVMGEAMAR